MKLLQEAIAEAVRRREKAIIAPAFDEPEIEITPWPVKGICTPTGSSKTQIAAEVIAADRKARMGAGDTGPMATRSWLYTVSLHRVSEAVADLFRKGLTARVVYGRDQWDRSIPGNADLPEDKRVLMCLENPEKIKMAIACGQSVKTTCCEGFPPKKKEDKGRRRKSKEKQRCQFRDQCGYWSQLEGEPPDVWVVAHNSMFHPQKEFKKIAGIIIDESFYEIGLFGVAKIKMREDEEPGFNLDEIADAPHRTKLIEMLRAHPPGGLRRDHFVKEHFVEEIDAEDCRTAILEEFEIAKRLKITPEMTPQQLEQAKRDAPACQRARHMVPVWAALRELLTSEDIDVSGRLVLTRNKKTGKTYLRVRGVRDIVEDRKVPTLLLDATLPSLDILQKFFPQVRAEDITDIDVDVPKHVHITQIVGAPVSIYRLFGTKKKPAVGERHLKSVLRLIQKWWLEHGRKETLVVCQQKVEGWLKDALPPEIKLEHFNNTRGLDIYRLVPSMLAIGRTIPSPDSVEAQAGALTGREPRTKVPEGEWYPQVPRAIRMADGSGIVVERTDQHPDPLCEALRWQACEAEVMQSLGRTRWINRDSPETALSIGIVSNTVLPITVNTVLPWQAPSAAVEMPVDEGIILTAPTDIARAWPGTTVRAAKYILQKLRALVPGRRAGTEDNFSVGAPDAGTQDNFSVGSYPTEILSSVPMFAALYQRRGPKQNLRWVFFDPSRVPNLRAKLEGLLKAALGKLLHVVRKGEIPPLAGESGVVTNAGVVQAGATLPWSTPSVEEVTDPVLGREIQDQCAGAEKRTATSPGGVSMVWYEATGGAAEGAVDLPGKFPWPTPKSLEPFVTREEMEAFWALPLVAR
jgi:putative DNA primase/helicase